MTISQNIHELHDPVTIPQVFNKAKHQPSNDRIQREPTFGRLNQQVNIVFCRMWVSLDCWASPHSPVG